MKLNDMRVCPECHTVLEDTLQYTINHIEDRTGLRTTGIPIIEMTVVCYTIQECSHCGQDVIVDEQTKTILRAGRM